MGAKTQLGMKAHANSHGEHAAASRPPLRNAAPETFPAGFAGNTILRSGKMKRFLAAACLTAAAAAPMWAQVGIGDDDFESAVDRCLALVDMNKDKKITAVEAREARNLYLSELKKAEAIADEDSRDEKVMEVQLKWCEIEAVFSPRQYAEMDKNGDRVLTREDLRMLDGDIIDMGNPAKGSKAPAPRKLTDKDVAWIIEQEWQIALDLYDANSDKKLDADELRKLAKLQCSDASSESHDAAEMMTYLMRGTLDYWLADFCDEIAGAETDEKPENPKDLSGVVIKKKDFEKQAKACHQKYEEDAALAEKQKSDPEFQKKAAEEAEKRRQDAEARKKERAAKRD